MIPILQIVAAICLLIIFITMSIKTFLHFKFMRIKHGKAGNLADYVNVSFRMKESINYIEAVLPVPILTKEEPNRLETLRRKINRSLLVVLISFMIFLATLIGVVIDKF